MQSYFRGNQSNNGPSLRTLQAGLLLRSGINDPMQHGIPEHCCNEASREWESASLLELCRQALRLDGFASTSEFETQSFLSRHLSTADNVGKLFTDVFGAIFAGGFDSVVDTTAGWTSESELPSFKPIPRNRPTTFDMLKPRGRGATAETIQYGTESEDLQVAEYAGLFVIDRQDLINDSLGVGAETIRQFGIAAARLRLDLVYAILLSNPMMSDGLPLFHTDHGNLLTPNALDAPGLGKAMDAIAAQTENDVALNLPTNALVVPSTLTQAAMSLANGLQLLDEEGSQPPTVHSDSRLALGVKDPATGTLHAGSTTQWYAAHAGTAPVEVSYLSGTNRLPELFSGFGNVGRFEFWASVTFDIGARAVEWKSICSSDA